MKITKKYLVMQGRNVTEWSSRFERVLAICNSIDLAEQYCDKIREENTFSDKYFWYEEIDWVEE